MFYIPLGAVLLVGTCHSKLLLIGYPSDSHSIKELSKRGGGCCSVAEYAEFWLLINVNEAICLASVLAEHRRSYAIVVEWQFPTSLESKVSLKSNT